MAPVGLALGGGGVRGAAHLGVINVLRREGFPIDCVAGSSAGALVGALAATGMDWDTVLVSILTGNWEHVRAPRLLGGRFFRNRMLQSLRDLVGDPPIETLPIPFAATAAELISGELLTITSGSLLEAVAASTALPGLFPPIRQNGKVLVDGGVLSPVPVRAARDLGADFVIAVDVSPDPPEEIRSNRELWTRLSWVMVGQFVEEELAEADFVIRPGVGEVDSLDFRRFLDCIVAGHRETKRVLPVLKRELSLFSDSFI